jgi:hypothetical protein
MVTVRKEITMILEYRDKAIEKAEYKKLEDGTWFAEIPCFQGAWANSSTVAKCRKERFPIRNLEC